MRFGEKKKNRQRLKKKGKTTKKIQPIPLLPPPPPLGRGDGSINSSSLSTGPDAAGAASPGTAAGTLHHGRAFAAPLLPLPPRLVLRLLHPELPPGREAGAGRHSSPTGTGRDGRFGTRHGAFGGTQWLYGVQRLPSPAGTTGLATLPGAVGLFGMAAGHAQGHTMGQWRRSDHSEVLLAP